MVTTEIINDPKSKFYNHLLLVSCIRESKGVRSPVMQKSPLLKAKKIITVHETKESSKPQHEKFEGQDKFDSEIKEIINTKNFLKSIHGLKATRSRESKVNSGCQPRLMSTTISKMAFNSRTSGDANSIKIPHSQKDISLKDERARRKHKFSSKVLASQQSLKMALQSSNSKRPTSTSSKKLRRPQSAINIKSQRSKDAMLYIGSIFSPSLTIEDQLEGRRTNIEDEATFAKESNIGLIRSPSPQISKSKSKVIPKRNRKESTNKNLQKSKIRKKQRVTFKNECDTGSNHKVKLIGVQDLKQRTKKKKLIQSKKLPAAEGTGFFGAVADYKRIDGVYPEQIERNNLDQK